MPKIIYSYEEMELYYNTIMRPLKDYEVYFLSLSARNKYLTDIERHELGLGRTEMFDRKMFRGDSFQKFRSIVSRYDIDNPYAYLSKSLDKSIPGKCMVCYININPSDILMAHFDYEKTMNEYMRELAIVKTENRRDENINHRITKAYNVLMNCVQKSKGTKYWIDIDCDVPIEYTSLVVSLQNELERNGVRVVVIQTHSGYHMLLERETLHYNFNIAIEEANRELNSKIVGHEIIVNKNSMVPLPGTLQAGSEVKIVDMTGGR